MVRKKVVEVQVDGATEISHEEESKVGDQPKPVSNRCNDNPVRIWIDIRISNGLHLSQKNLSYQDLVRMVRSWRAYAECYRSESFFYVRDFTDMRCKHSRALSIICERLHREACDGDAFIVISRNRRCVQSPDSYKTMGVTEEAMNIVSDGYKAYVLIGDELRSAQFKGTMHQVCMSHAKIFTYLDNGELLIDNNLAERTIRKLTAQHNNLLHYSSDVGAEIATVIGTVKLHGSPLWNFIGTFFKISLTSLWLPANVKFKTD